MKREEFQGYLNFINLTEEQIITEDKHGISTNRVKSTAIYSRVGQELAVAENWIRNNSLQYQENLHKSVAYGERKAESDFEENNEVSKGELKQLTKSLEQFGNACASRINVLMGERV